MIDELLSLKAESGISNRDIAALLNVTPTMVARYRNGAQYRKHDRLDLVIKLVRVLVKKGYLPANDYLDREVILQNAWRKAAPKELPLVWR